MEVCPMKCKKCGQELNGNEKFCPNCGQPVEIEEEKKQEPSEKVDANLNGENVVEEQWYFVENNESKGPFTKVQMKEFYDAGRINDMTFVWHDGQSDWESLKASSLSFEEAQSTNTLDEWYYIDFNQNRHGPYSKTQMNAFLANNTIGANTYIWREGMADWDTLNHTELYLSPAHYNSNNIPPRNYNYTYIKRRSILLCIVYSIITCGIYMIYWQYSIARDTNALLRSNGYEEGTSPGLVVFFSIITFGLYIYYFVYKVAKTMVTIDDTNKDNGILYIVLTFFGLSIVAYAIIQDSINSTSDI